MGEDRSPAAVVTGAAGGIGEAVVSELLRREYDIIAVDRRSVQRAHRSSTAGKSSQGTVIDLHADVTQRAAAYMAIARAVEHFGKIDVLVNVVGGLRGPIIRDFMSIDDAQWDFAMNVNLRSTFVCMQAALEQMIPQSSGRIVNIASVSWAGSPDHTDYAVAKAGVVSLTRSVALQVASYRITVNAVAPGLTATTHIGGLSLPEAINIPSGRPNQPSDVADAVGFLCSAAARNITGQILNVAGGLNPSI